MKTFCDASGDGARAVRPRVQKTNNTRMSRPRSNRSRHIEDFFRLCSLGKICFHPAMPKVPLKTIVAYCDKILRTRNIGDYDGAANGLQEENYGADTSIAEN